jgi:hypothetical protein
MRSSTVPLSHTTSRLETVTLLRLARIVNFIKSLLDAGLSIPEPLPAGTDIANLRERNDIGKKLLQYFLYDGKIRGISRNGRIFEHSIDVPLVQQFREGLKSVHIQGAGNEKTI